MFSCFIVWGNNNLLLLPQTRKLYGFLRPFSCFPSSVVEKRRKRRKPRFPVFPCRFLARHNVAFSPPRLCERVRKSKPRARVLLIACARVLTRARLHGRKGAKQNSGLFLEIGTSRYFSPQDWGEKERPGIIAGSRARIRARPHMYNLI